MGSNSISGPNWGGAERAKLANRSTNSGLKAHATSVTAVALNTLTAYGPRIHSTDPTVSTAIAATIGCSNDPIPSGRAVEWMTPNNK
ncbi:MAG: hypothetical protein S4CHLAM81_07960 [Chlamydiales bacterium]|nr:hypothetical protein [Chlamydiales bacterium]MCH9635578.1 hypothetical protein [Chlamydiales bacterium]